MITARRLRAREEPTRAPNPTSISWDEHQRQIQELTKAHSIELSRLSGPSRDLGELLAEFERVQTLAAERSAALESSSREVARLQQRVTELEDELAAKAKASLPADPPKAQAPATPTDSDQKKKR